MLGGLLGLIIGIIVIIAVCAIFFLTIDKIVGDATLQKIGKIVIGVIALCAVIIAAWGALFGGGASGMVQISGAQLVAFAVGLLIIIAVVYILNIAIAWFGFMVNELQYLLGIVALIAVLLVAGGTLFSAGPVNSLFSSSPATRR